ncbi:MAG: hypothetical protein V4489_00250 [Chlamydiota bacterium]
MNILPLFTYQTTVSFSPKKDPTHPWSGHDIHVDSKRAKSMLTTMKNIGPVVQLTITRQGYFFSQVIYSGSSLNLDRLRTIEIIEESESGFSVTVSNRVKEKFPDLFVKQISTG